MEPNRIWGEKCSKSDIVINQGPTAPLPSGIPTYTVEIMNMCVSGCDISKIHLRCGWFSSARLINPKLFKRLRYNDCLVNDGRPLINGATISFQYANTFLYPLSVSSVVCVWTLKSCMHDYITPLNSFYLYILHTIGIWICGHLSLVHVMGMRMRMEMGMCFYIFLTDRKCGEWGHGYKQPKPNLPLLFFSSYVSGCFGYDDEMMMIY